MARRLGWTRCLHHLADLSALPQTPTSRVVEGFAVERPGRARAALVDEVTIALEREPAQKGAARVACSPGPPAKKNIGSGLAWRRRWRDDSHAQLDTSAAWLAAVFWYCQPTAEQAFARLGVRTGPEGRDARRVGDWRYGDLARASDGAHDETPDSCRKRTPCSRSVVLIDSFDSAFDIDDVDSGLLDPEPRRCVYGRVATKLVSWLVPAGGGLRGTGDWGWPGMMHRPVALSSVATPSTTSWIAPLCGQPRPATAPRRK